MNSEHDPKRKWLIEVTEEQLVEIINAVEDIHRFMCGQCDLGNTVISVGETHENRRHIREALKRIERYVAPELSTNASYDWAGSGCPEKRWKRRIAMTYGIYRELMHQLTLFRGDKYYSVYYSDTLTCEDSVPLPKLTPIDEEGGEA